jgi:hypothetical protein
VNTLLLDQATWDLTVDSMGSIAVASDPYSVAQDVATACRLFLGELWYDTTQGLPYFQRILGKLPPSIFIKQQLIAAARSAPEVAGAKVFFNSFKNRALAGQIHLTLASGAVIVTNLAPSALPWWTSAVSPAAAGSPAGGP